ncbi:hypothetical protein FOMG_15116 [Fusarium oxysporum f. sp. melonis 26406]|uniref:Uncharacterized protein n=1 Tax=Fusarium oxysporum f. sp. melonis 26406 TaxID=1089452 RepID=W9ZK64_FUSOX|nr:hypothetical protein FOMG_15116 [Fusarium oxysporum f. sp. melonis 26406]
MGQSTMILTLRVIRTRTMMPHGGLRALRRVTPAGKRLKRTEKKAQIPRSMQVGKVQWIPKISPRMRRVASRGSQSTLVRR